MTYRVTGWPVKGGSVLGYFVLSNYIATSEHFILFPVLFI